MTIPTGVNHLQFYHQAKVKGIKLRSKYVGVFFKMNRSGAPSWYCKVQKGIDSTYHFFQVFPFTEEGEKEAAEKYKQVSQRLGKQVVTKKRLGHKEGLLLIRGVKTSR